MGPPADHLDDPGEVPPFVDVGELKDDRIDLAAARLGVFLPLLRHLRPRKDSEQGASDFGLVYDRSLRSKDLMMPRFFATEALQLKPLFHRDALCDPDPSFPATLFAIAGLPGALPTERVFCSSSTHAVARQTLYPDHHLVCRCSATGRHNQVRDLLAAALRRADPTAKVAVEQTAAYDGSPQPRAWGSRGSYAPGDVTFQAQGKPALYLDVVVSVGRTHRDMSAAAGAYHDKLRARYQFLRPRCPMSRHEANTRAPLSSIDYVPMAFSTLGAAAPKTMSTLDTLLGRHAAREFRLSAAKAIHMAQAKVVANARFAHREGRRAEPASDEALAPEQPPAGAIGPLPPDSSRHPHPPGLPASPFFVPLILAAHADHVERDGGQPPPDVARALIDSAHQSYDAWSGSLHEKLPSWLETIRAIPRPIAGWPPFGLIAAKTQEQILRLDEGVLPPAFLHVQRWISCSAVPDGWSVFARSTAPQRGRTDRRRAPGHHLNPLPVDDD